MMKYERKMMKPLILKSNLPFEKKLDKNPTTVGVFLHKHMLCSTPKKN